ncbi:2-oxo acid dehydrogenase subunit E2 [Geodermatophilus ruber]|uniref:2-oxo acid dehydrogenase subunit E2 n=1 Tax=Geodermatophilus ruber TaxID=504800 RepID=UPI001C42E59D|nr:2-oxo acid dehydrogenase subunit E2 [Geodermatophilus ruber]
MRRAGLPPALHLAALRTSDPDGGVGRDPGRGEASQPARAAPQYHLSSTIDLRAATDWLRETNAGRPVSRRLALVALLLGATARAAARVPEVNGFLTDDRFRPSGAVHLGVAVALRGGGRATPTLRDAETLPLDALMQQLRDVVARARDGRLPRTATPDATLTVINLGDLGAEAYYGVITPPQVAQVGYGRLREQPWAADGMLGIRPAVTATLSADHRVSDGARGGRFLRLVGELLQHPEDL